MIINVRHTFFLLFISVCFSGCQNKSEETESPQKISDTAREMGKIDALEKVKNLEQQLQQELDDKNKMIEKQSK